MSKSDRARLKELRAAYRLIGECRLLHPELITLLRAQGVAGEEAADVASLTPQLRRVLAHALRGESEKGIASRLGISRHTVNRHLHRLYRHFGVRSRSQLIYRCLGSLPDVRPLDGDE